MKHGHLITNSRDEIRDLLVLVVVVHPGVVHDGVVAAEDVEAEAGRRTVAVVQRAGEQPRRRAERIASYNEGNLLKQRKLLLIF